MIIFEESSPFTEDDFKRLQAAMQKAFDADVLRGFTGEHTVVAAPADPMTQDKLDAMIEMLNGLPDVVVRIEHAPANRDQLLAALAAAGVKIDGGLGDFMGMRVEVDNRIPLNEIRFVYHSGKVERIKITNWPGLE